MGILEPLLLRVLFSGKARVQRIMGILEPSLLRVLFFLEKQGATHHGAP